MQPIPIDPTAPPIPKICVVCRQPGRFLCTGCRVYYYCGVEHQAQHWVQHKAQCVQVSKVARASAENVAILLIGWMRDAFSTRHLPELAERVRRAGRSLAYVITINTTEGTNQPGVVEPVPHTVSEYMDILHDWPSGAHQIQYMRTIMRPEMRYVFVQLIARYPTASEAEGPQHNWVVYPVPVV